MAYNKAHENINWQNLPSEATALNAINFNKMDNSIDVIDNRVIALDTARINDEASLANKVDKVAGKGLSTNDYTTTEKNKLAGIEAGAQVNTVTGVKGNSEGSYRTGNVNITKANIGLGNVDNTSDANKPVSTAAQTALGNKVDKVAGKGLSTNDYTDAEKTKLAGIETGANKTIVDSSLSGSSTNPVQNKVAKSALDGKVDKVTNYGLSLYKDIGYYQTAEGQTGTYIGYVGGKNQNGQLQALGDIYNGVVVDSALSSSSTNPVENKAIYDALNNLLPSKTVSGNPISISDASGLNAKALTVSMNPIQDLHGYDNPWVGGAGKNKLPFDIDEIKANNTNGTWSDNAYDYRGATYTLSNDGKINVTGTISSANASAILLANNIVLPSGTYLLSGIFNGSSGTYRLRYSVNSGSYYNIYDGDSPEITLNGTDTLRIQIYMANNFVCPAEGITFEPMLRLATETDATFAPYSNICPISGRTEVSVTRTGVNQWDEQWENGSYNSTTGEKNTWSGAIRNKNYIMTYPNKTYRIVSPINEQYVFFYDKNKNYLSYVQKRNAYEFTTPANCYYFNFSTNSAYGQTYNNNISINYPSTDTEYHAYQGETHTHQYSETVYGGVDDFVNGGAEKIWVCESVSDLTWQSSTNGKFYSGMRTSVIVKGTYGHYGDMIISSSYIGVNKPTTGALTNGEMSVDANGYIQICDTDCTDATDFFTKRGSVQLCYKLATPTTIETSAEEIELLKGQNVLSTDADDMELEYSVSLDSLLPTTTRTLAKSPIVEEPKEETEEQR